MRAAVLLFILALAACQSPCPAPDTGPTTSQLRCEDGSELTVTFTRSPDEARVAQDGYATLILPARIASGGYRYADNGSELRGRGAEVSWTRTGAEETICTGGGAE